jgi:hypothetical protein
METLHLPDLTRLLNNPIYHDPHWPPMSTKFPLDIPKFESKPNEDPGDHVTTFHLWCSSNSLRDDSVELHFFQCTLIGSAEKRYIIPSFPVQLGGKTMCVEVEVVDVSLDYNLLLGRSWTYAMQQS